MNSWYELFSRKDNAIGEVAGVEAGRIEIYIYPEFYPSIHVGTILAINSEKIKAMGLVIKLAHSSRYGSFTPMKSTRQEIRQAYPDLDKYHNFVSTMVYTSHLYRDQIIHVRASMPRLHDLVYIVHNELLLDKFFKPKGSWDFSFLRYYILEGAGPLEVKEFFYKYKDYFIKHENEKECLIKEVTRILLKSRVKNVPEYLEDLCDTLGW